MSEQAATIVMVIGAILISIALVVPLAPELIIRLWTKEEEKALKPKTVHLHLAMLAATGLGIFSVNSLIFSSYARITPEAEINLGELYRLQIEYFGEHNTYAGRKGINGNGCFADLKWEPNRILRRERGTRYTYYCGEDKVLPTRKGSTSPYDPKSNWPVEVRPQSTSRSFTVMAIANVDSDPPLDVWALSDSWELKWLVDGAAKIDNPGPVGKWIENFKVFLRPMNLVSLIFLSPFLVVILLAPFLWLSVAGDWQHYQWLRHRPSAEAKPGPGGDEDRSGPGSAS